MFKFRCTCGWFCEGVRILYLMQVIFTLVNPSVQIYYYALNFFVSAKTPIYFQDYIYYDKKLPQFIAVKDHINLKVTGVSIFTVCCDQRPQSYDLSVREGHRCCSLPKCAISYLQQGSSLIKVSISQQILDSQRLPNDH